MSVSQMCNDGIIFICMKDRVSVYKEEGALIMCKWKAILIDKQDEHGRYRIRL